VLSIHDIAEVIDAEVEARIAPFVGELTGLKAMVAELTARLETQITTGPPGPPGERGADGAPGRDGAAGRDGIDGLPGTDGASVLGPEGPAGRDGRDGLPGVPGVTGEKGQSGIDGKDGRDGLDGKDGLGFDDFHVEHDGRRGLTFVMQRGDQVKTWPIVLPVPMYADEIKWLPDHRYAAQDVVMWDGSGWLCKDAESIGKKPGTPQSGWVLIIKRGRDGIDGKHGRDGLNGKDGINGKDGRLLP